MPSQTAPVKVNLSGALKAHAKDKTDYGREFTNLPGGITGGIAELVEAKIGVYKSGKNTGQKFIYMAGVVRSPKTALELKKIWEPVPGNPKGQVKIISNKMIDIDGQRTSIMLPLCATEKGDGKGGTVQVTLDQNVEDALNEVRKLGGEECTAHVQTEEDLAQLLATLKSQQPGIRFKFGTSEMDPNKDYPNGARVFENWYGTKGLENYVPEAADKHPALAATQDGTAPSANGDGQPAEQFNEFDASTSMDLDQLVEAANGDGDVATDAQARLIALATEKGREDEARAAESWADVKAVIEAEDALAEAPAEEAPAPAAKEPWKPKAGEMYMYKPLDPKTNKPQIDKATKKPVKGVEVEILTVTEKDTTVTLKNYDTGKTIMGADKKPLKVKWTDLAGE